jgi:uncharacterized protein YndB with AHSA1/START domain/uncharacterized damage-inducible protein DinB
MTYTSVAVRSVNASPAEVYHAFTHAMSLTEWMCDFATVAPRPGGRMYLWWHGDFYSSGEYLALEENRSIKFKWFGRFDPAPSEVEVVIDEMPGGSMVSMAHIVPDGPGWKRRGDEFQQQWDATLQNLVQVMETGLDKRTYDRPMLGIQISDFNAEIARHMGIPVSEGCRLDTPLENMGAAKAGLRKDDVIVELNGKTITNDFGTFIKALSGKKGGDQVEVVFYRGPEKKTVTMELTKRPIPQYPWDPAELAKQVRARYDQGLAALEKAFQGVSEAKADAQPAPGEWSAKQTLAHLIHNDRNWLQVMDDLVGGYTRVADDFGGNINVHIAATVAAYKTAGGLLDELLRLSDEVVAFTAALPPAFVARKASYHQAANSMLEGFLPHVLSHLEQIRAALKKAGKK